MKNTKNKLNAKAKNDMTLQSFFQNRKNIENLIFIALLTLIGIMARVYLFPKPSSDYRNGCCELRKGACRGIIR